MDRLFTVNQAKDLLSNTYNFKQRKQVIPASKLENRAVFHWKLRNKRNEWNASRSQTSRPAHFRAIDLFEPADLFVKNTACKQNGFRGFEISLFRPLCIVRMIVQKSPAMNIVNSKQLEEKRKISADLLASGRE